MTSILDQIDHQLKRVFYKGFADLSTYVIWHGSDSK